MVRISIGGHLWTLAHGWMPYEINYSYVYIEILICDWLWPVKRIKCGRRVELLLVNVPAFHIDHQFAPSQSFNAGHKQKTVLTVGPLILLPRSDVTPPAVGCTVWRLPHDAFTRVIKLARLTSSFVGWPRCPSWGHTRGWHRAELTHARRRAVGRFASQPNCITPGNYYPLALRRIKGSLVFSSNH